MLCSMRHCYNNQIFLFLFAQEKNDIDKEKFYSFNNDEDTVWWSDDSSDDDHDSLEQEDDEHPQSEKNEDVLNDKDYEMEDMEGISDDKNESNANDEEDPSERFTDNSCFPTNRIAIVFFFVLISLHGRYLTDERPEVVMMYINIVLDICGDTNYRFPKYARTFVGWCQLSAVAHKGIQTYVCCTKCKAIHPYQTDTDKYNLKRQRLCLNHGISPNSMPCQNSLFNRNTGNNTQLEPIPYFY